jgi:hypothetical protein
VGNHRSENGEDEKRHRGESHLHTDEERQAAEELDRRAKRREHRRERHAATVDLVDERIQVRELGESGR